jgi:tRNA pseudouridine38-40 synthase
MNTYKMTIAYDGAAYSGWQIQANGTSIQELIQNALSTALRKPTTLHGSGRTDAGVHARGQVAHFTCTESLALSSLQASLNGLLPKDIRILEIAEASPSFHARYSAKGKIYHYDLHLHPIADPFSKEYRYHVPHPVDLTLLEQAASQCIGTHDFTSFSHEAHLGSAAKNPIRTLHRLTLSPIPQGLRLEFEGDGFLYKMVRNLVGTLLDISCGKISIDELSKIFAARDRRKAGRTAPPHALFLTEVKY